MDKLTTEQKAERYVQALDRAKKWYNAPNIDKMPTYGNRIIEEIFPELKESEDWIPKEIIKYLKEKGDFRSCWIAWLKKQGQTFTKKDVDDAWLKGMCDAKHELEKQGEQKPADKVEPKDYNSIDPHFGKPADKFEPKFQNGQWITNGDYTWKIVEVKPLDYILQSQDGNIVADTISHVDEQFHSFTIKDAKDGDVLYSPCLSLLWIFKSIDTVYCGCNLNYNDGAFCGEGYIERPTDAIPATKEQRDTLEKAMADAGYTFDFEKKELKKISQRMISAEAKEAMYGNPAWSGEDENEVAILEAYIRSGEWSESHIDRALGIVDELVNKVKSLRPQNRWKPSEEQIMCLQDALSDYHRRGYKAETLETLLKQLKQL